MTVVVNGAFRPQRVTGQQRYATEIADRLLERDGFVELQPTGRWRGSATREWLWSLGPLALAAKGRTVLSLTARGPVLKDHVLVVHDLFPLTDPQWYSRSFVVTHAPVLRAQLARARAFVAVSEPVAEQLRERYRTPVVTAPNAPSDVFSRPPSDADGALAEHGITAGRYLLTVGSLDPRKNLPRLAEAWALVPEARRLETPLVLVGGAAAIYRQGSLAWPTGTQALGYVSDDELRQLYAGARAVVFPSLAEGFGLPLVEATAAGAQRLVVSDIPVFRWICGDGAAYFDPASVDAIAAGLESAIAGDGPRAGVRAGHDWKHSADIIATLCTRGG